MRRSSSLTARTDTVNCRVGNSLHTLDRDESLKRDISSSDSKDRLFFLIDLFEFIRGLSPGAIFDARVGEFDKVMSSFSSFFFFFLKGLIGLFYR